MHFRKINSIEDLLKQSSFRYDYGRPSSLQDLERKLRIILKIKEEQNFELKIKRNSPYIEGRTYVLLLTDDDSIGTINSKEYRTFTIFRKSDSAAIGKATYTQWEGWYIHDLVMEAAAEIPDTNKTVFRRERRSPLEHDFKNLNKDRAPEEDEVEIEKELYMEI